MLKKSTTAKILTTVIASAAIIPVAIAVVPTEASAASLADVIVEKDGVLYSLDLDTYLLMKSAGAFPKNVELEYISSSDNQVYKLDDYLSAKSVSKNIVEAFGALERLNYAVKGLDIGEIIVDESGSIKWNDPANVATFSVISID